MQQLINKVSKINNFLNMICSLDERFKIIEYLLDNKVGDFSIGTLKTISDATGLSKSKASSFLKILEEKEVIQRHGKGVFKLNDTLLSMEENAPSNNNLTKVSFLSNPNIMVYQCKYDEDWTVEFVSDACSTITGYPPDYFIQNKNFGYNSIIAPQHRAFVWRNLSNMLDEGLPYHFEYEIVTATGQRKRVLEVGQGILDAQERVIATEGIIIEVTNRKEESQSNTEMEAKSTCVSHD